MVSEKGSSSIQFPRIAPPQPTLELDLQPAQLIWEWYCHYARDLPWRSLKPTDQTSYDRAWAIMISEFMLQQTPVKRVIPYWYDWINRWPTPVELSAEPVAEAIRAWERLGYPRRAKRLHESAKIIATDWENRVPSTVSDLLNLPGVGQYTAGAIAHFAYGVVTPVVDINIRRVLNRVWLGNDIATPQKSDMTIMEELMQKISNPLISLPASLMEFGAILCTARNPLCLECPIRSSCTWHSLGKPPVTSVRRSQKYTGTDRYVRGLLLELLRSTYIPVESTRFEPLWPDHIQRERALQSLMDDGLVSQDKQGKYTLALG